MKLNWRFFASPAVSWYLARTFVARSAAVLLALLVILMTLDLLGESGDILAHPGNGQVELWYYVSLRAPQIAAFLLPFSVLLGTLITLVRMNQNSEIISMKAAGISAHQILAPLVAASLAIAGLSFWFEDHVTARATAVLSAWQNADYGPIPDTRGVVGNVWVRVHEDLIHAGSASGRGARTVLRDVTYYDRTADKLTGVITAPLAVPVAGAWQLRRARRFDVASGVVRLVPAITVGAGVTPDRFTLADVNGDGLSFRGLAEVIATLRAAGRPTSPLETILWHKIVSPLSTMLMPLLAGVAGFGLARSGKLFVRTIIGMTLGFAYFVADNFALAMGNLGAYPPLLAAWAPFLLFLLIGEAVLIRTEE